MQVQQQGVDLPEKKQNNVSVDLLEKHISSDYLDKQCGDVSAGLLDKQYKGTRNGPELNKTSGGGLEDTNNSNNEEVVPEDDHGDQNSGNNEADLSTESDEELTVVPTLANIIEWMKEFEWKEDALPPWMSLDDEGVVRVVYTSHGGVPSSNPQATGVNTTHSSSDCSSGDSTGDTNTDSTSGSGNGDCSGGESESSGDISCSDNDVSSYNDSSSSSSGESEDPEAVQISAGNIASKRRKVKTKKKKKKGKGKKPPNSLLPAASPRTRHQVDRSKGSKEPTKPKPTGRRQSGREGDTSDDQNRFKSVNDGSKQPSMPSAGAGITGDSSRTRVPANIEQLAAEKSKPPSPAKPDRFPPVNSDALPSDSDHEYAGAVHQCMSSDQAAVSSVLVSSGWPTYVGGAMSAPLAAAVLCPVTPYNYSVVMLDERAISGQSTMPPSVGVFGWYQEFDNELLQFVAEQSDKCLVTVVTKDGVLFRSARGFDLGFMHYYCRAEVPEIPEFSTRAAEVMVLTASDLDALVRRGIRVRGLLVVLWELGSLPPERLPRQLIARILTRVYKFAAVVLRAGGRLSVQLMDDLQIRVDTCTVLIQAAALPLIPPGHTPASDGPVCSSTAVHCSSCSRVSEVSLHHFIKMLLKESGLYEDVELRTEVFRTLFPTRLTVCAATKH